jgi:hypothetical protein
MHITDVYTHRLAAGKASLAIFVELCRWRSSAAKLTGDRNWITSVTITSECPNELGRDRRFCTIGVDLFAQWRCLKAPDGIIM